MTTEKAIVKQIDKNDSWTTYGVYVNGALVGKIERSVFADRKRFAGRTYGYDLAKKAHFRITEVNGKRSDNSYYMDSRQDAVNWLISLLK